MAEGRWLDRDETATHVGRRVDELPRLVKRGLLPKPSFHFGPRSPRWDRLALDALFTNKPSHRSLEEAEQDAVDAIIKRARKDRQKAVGRRHNQGIPLRHSG